MPLHYATKAFSYTLAKFWISFCCKLYNILLSRMRISQNLDLCFLGGLISNFFLSFFCFPFSLPFFSLYLLTFIPFLSTGKVLASALLKTWKSIEHWSTRWLGLFYHHVCTQNWTRFYWYSSARIWSIFKMVACSRRSDSGGLAKNKAGERAGKKRGDPLSSPPVSPRFFPALSLASFSLALHYLNAWNRLLKWTHVWMDLSLLC